MLKAVIFDFDGVIVDSLPIVLDIMKNIAQRDGYGDLIEEYLNVSEHEAKELFRKSSARELLAYFNIPPMKIVSYHSKIKYEMVKRIPEFELFKGIDKVIKDLSKNFKVGILSTNNKAFLVKILTNYKLINYFDCCVSGISMFGKARKINKLLRDLKLKPNEAIYIGDERKDIEACKKARIKIISVTWGYDDKNVLKKAKPDFIAEKPKDIIKIVNNIGKDESKKTTKKTKGK